MQSAAVATVGIEPENPFDKLAQEIVDCERYGLHCSPPPPPPGLLQLYQPPGIVLLELLGFILFLGIVFSRRIGRGTIVLLAWPVRLWRMTRRGLRWLVAAVEEEARRE